MLVRCEFCTASVDEREIINHVKEKHPEKKAEALVSDLLNNLLKNIFLNLKKIIPGNGEEMTQSAFTI